MKALLILFSLILIKPGVWAQLKATPVCPPFVIDLLGGSVNKLSSKSTIGEIQKMFPCESSVLEEDSAKCSGIFFKDLLF